MELEDPKRDSCYCIATVVNVIGPRIRLRLDGCSSSNDVWKLCDSREIHPIGWCKDKGFNLEKPKG